MRTFHEMWIERRRTRALKAELRAAATAAPSNELWVRIRSETSDLPAHAHTAKSRPRFRFTPLAGAALALATLGTGAVVAKQGWLGWRAPSQHRIGPFLLSGFFHGRMECYDAAGQLLAVQDTILNGLRGGRFDVSASLPNATISMASKSYADTSKGSAYTYSLHDESGRTIATLVLKSVFDRDDKGNPWLSLPDPKSAEEGRQFVEKLWAWQTSQWKTGTQSMDESPIGVTGYDCQLGLVWSVRGACEVSVLPVDAPRGYLPQRGGTSTIGGKIGRAIAEYAGAHPEPEFHAVYRGERYRVVGYGRHELRATNGAPALIVAIDKP